MLLGPCLVCPAFGIRMAALLILLWSLPCRIRRSPLHPSLAANSLNQDKWSQSFSLSFSLSYPDGAAALQCRSSFSSSQGREGERAN